MFGCIKQEEKLSDLLIRNEPGKQRLVIGSREKQGVVERSVTLLGEGKVYRKDGAVEPRAKRRRLLMALVLQ